MLPVSSDDSPIAGEEASFSINHVVVELAFKSFPVAQKVPTEAFFVIVVEGPLVPEPILVELVPVSIVEWLRQRL